MRKVISMLLVLVILSCSMMLPVSAEEDDAVTPAKLYPDNLLASEANFEKYFRDTTDTFTFEEVDGEYVMTVLSTNKSGYFVLCKDPIPYETYTITMDVAVNLSTADTWEKASGDEACMLVGCTNPIGTGHQVRSLVAYKKLHMRHELIGAVAGKTFTAVRDDDADTGVAAGDDVYITYRFEVYPDEILVYFEGNYVNLTNSDGHTGQKSYFGFRGTGEGWKVKNVQVYEGIYDPETWEPPVTETEAPTEAPETDEVTQAPEQSPIVDNENQQDGNNMTGILIGAIIVAVVVIAGCAVVIVLVMKKKK